MEWWNKLGELSHGNLLGDLGIDVRAIIIQIVTVLIMLWVIKKVFFTPLKEALDGRTQYLENTYAEAENLRSEMERIRKEYEEKLATSEAESRSQIQAAIGEAQKLKEQITTDARAQGEEIVRRAQEEIVREKEHALLEIRGKVVDLALSAAEKVTKETMSDERHRKLVELFVEEAGVA